MRHAAWLGLVPALLAAQNPPTGVVAGRVTTRADSVASAPAQGAAVVLVGTPLGAVAGTDGRFMITGVPAGPRTLRVRLPGHRMAERPIVVRDGDTVRVDVVLQPDAQLLSPIRTDVRRIDAEMFVSKPNVGTIALTATAMAGVPAVGEPDVVRIVQLLPGVAARNDYNTGLNVHGGEADQNLVLLDGFPIYNPFHLGGLFSTFMDATVGGIQLVTSAFPARYGGRLSSVLEVQSAGETRPGVNAQADISALGASAKLGGLFGGGRGMWTLAGRRTYADAATRIFTDNIFPYHFRDVHGRATYLLPGDLLLAVTAYGGRDVLDANLAAFDTDSVPSRAGAGQWAFNWGNSVLGATISRDLGARTTLEQRLSTSGFSTLLDLGAGSFSQRSEIRDLRLGGSLQRRGMSHDGAVGYDVATHRIRYASSSSETGTTEFDIVQRPVLSAVWISDVWRASRRWVLEGGLRGEALSTQGGAGDWAGLSPRLSVKYFARSNLAVTAGAGRVTQSLHSLAGDGPLRYFDIWLGSDSLVPVATAWHYATGVERRIRESGSVRLEAYFKRYDRVLEANWSEDAQRPGDEFFVANGSSYGADVHARWQRGDGAQGWVAYSYGVASRSRDGARWAPGHDRRHDLDVVATRRIAKYRVGGRVGYSTGTPYTHIVGEIARRVYDPSRDSWGTGDPMIWIESLGGARNGARFPATHRIDLDVSRQFRALGASIAPYVSVANASNAKNVFVYLYNYSTDRPTRRAISQFPVLPSLGVRIEF